MTWEGIIISLGNRQTRPSTKMNSEQTLDRNNIKPQIDLTSTKTNTIIVQPSETEHQEPEPSTKMALEKVPDKTIQHESYTAGKLTSVPELVQFMGYKTTTDIGKIANLDLLKVIK